MGDTGLKNLARVLSLSNSVFYVDLRQNGMSNKCANTLYEMLRFNESIIHFEFGSTVGSHPNRLGKEVCEKLGKVFETGVTLLQFLSLAGTSICAEDL